MSLYESRRGERSAFEASRRLRGTTTYQHMSSPRICSSEDRITGQRCNHAPTPDRSSQEVVETNTLRLASIIDIADTMHSHGEAVYETDNEPSKIYDVYTADLYVHRQSGMILAIDATDAVDEAVKNASQTARLTIVAITDAKQDFHIHPELSQHELAIIGPNAETGQDLCNHVSDYALLNLELSIDRYNEQ